MRTLKGSSGYLKNQVRKNLAKASLSLTVLLAFLLLLTYMLLFIKSFSVYEPLGFFALIPLVVAFQFYLHKYRTYNGGLKGEKQVSKFLNSQFNDDFLLLNDFYLNGGRGDIDHVVLAPTGIFVIETKNWSGAVSCNGDDWTRVGRGKGTGSPSRQVKQNASLIKHILDASPTQRGISVYVEGLVVFTNKHVTLHLNNPAVTILKLLQLPNYLITRQTYKRYTRQELEQIGKELLNEKR